MAFLAFALTIMAGKSWYDAETFAQKIEASAAQKIEVSADHDIVPVAYGREVSPVESSAPIVTAYAQAPSVGDWLKDNWVVLLFAFLGFVEAVIRLTPTEVDNSIFNILKRLIDAWFPNHKANGGRFD
jgi:hypothetical protein